MNVSFPCSGDLDISFLTFNIPTGSMEAENLLSLKVSNVVSTSYRDKNNIANNENLHGGQNYLHC